MCATCGKAGCECDILEQLARQEVKLSIAKIADSTTSQQTI